jgi:hypothetical protein
MSARDEREMAIFQAALALPPERWSANGVVAQLAERLVRKKISLVGQFYAHMDSSGQTAVKVGTSRISWST